MSAELQLVQRLSPRPIIYIRAKPVTCTNPTAAQAEQRLRFAIAAREASKYTVEQVARMVGGRVVEVNGVKAVQMPDGRILLRQQAYISYMLTGSKSADRKTKLPLWAQRLTTTVRFLYATPTPRT